MINRSIKGAPRSINCDFEKAIINSASKAFPGVDIYACFFHLSQSFFRQIQLKGFLKDFYSNSEFRKNYKMMQSLCFLPKDDVIEGFLVLSSVAVNRLRPLLEYLEKYYIGQKNSNSQRKVPLFPIPMWNLYERVLNGDPRTNNNVESWHSQIQLDVNSNLTLNKLINLFRNEQGNTETKIVQILSGDVYEKSKKSLKKDTNLLNLCKKYNKETILQFLTSCALLLDD